MAPVYKIAVIQLYPKPLDAEQNHAKAISFIRKAAEQGADLAVLPEYHLTNWAPEDPKFGEICEDYQKYVDAYCKLAKELNICIVPGTIVEKREDGKLLNIAYFISKDGSILGNYQKKNLWLTERSHLTGSEHAPHEVFDTPIGKVGILICWDLAFPEAFRQLIAAGAKTIIIPSFWTLNDCIPAGLKRNPLSEAVFLNSALALRAFENTCMVVFANAGGPPEKPSRGNYAGLSQVTIPFVGALGRLEAEEGMSVVEVDMQVLEDAEENYQVRADLAREGWHYSYTLAQDRPPASDKGNAKL
ncbi:carbon-nitrogen hydrolase [Xylogone sp. PMI_703]|nr:carbon-nitrogen hydrolase [Xylogone sp. PMI_703]